MERHASTVSRRTRLGPPLAMTLAIALLSPTTAHASDYFVTPSGDDAGAGDSAAEAWRTLDKLRTEADAGRFGPGDRILLERGAVFPGGLRIDGLSGRPDRPIVIGAYGRGEPPIIDGLERLDGWSTVGEGLWQARCDGCDDAPNRLLLDGKARPLARWPNASEADEGYLYHEGAESRTRIRDAELSASPDWSGAEAVVRTNYWILDRLTVRDHRADTLVFAEQATYPIRERHGYFIQNHPAALDEDGEWTYDPRNRLVTLRLAGGPPGPGRVRVSAVDSVLTLAGARHVSLRDLELRGGNEVNLLVQGCEALEVRRTRLTEAGTEGARLDSCKALDFVGNTISDASDTGLRVRRCEGCRLRGNRIQRVGLLAGMGESGNSRYNGMVTDGEDVLVEGNRVDRIGYLGIDVRSEGTVRNNHVSRYGLTKTDGGGIYTWGHADLDIVANIVTGGIGSAAGVPSQAIVPVHGIYVDDESERIRVRDNTVRSVSASGVYLHNTRDVSVRGNTVVGSGGPPLRFVDDRRRLDPGEPDLYRVQDSTVTGNRLVDEGSGLMATFSTERDEGFLGELGVLDDNVYCSLFAAPVFQRRLPGLRTAETTLSFGQWRAAYGQDGGSRLCPTRRSHEVSREVGADRVANGRFDADTDGWLRWPEGTASLGRDAEVLGGSLRLGYEGGRHEALFLTPIGAVEAGRLYRLRVRAVSDGERVVRLYLRQRSAPYRPLTLVETIVVGDRPAEHELFLSATDGEPDSYLVLSLSAGNSPVWLDDIGLHEVIARPRDDVLRVELNPRSEARSVILDDGDYVDVDGRRLPNGSAIDIPPYGSRVLLRGSTPATKWQDER